jgi:opacity protein-like surface antigen
MRRAIGFLALALFLGAAVPAFAQDKPVDVNIGGGYTFAFGDVRDHLGDGYNINFGVTFNLSETIGIQGEYSFNGLGQKNIQIPVSPTPNASTVPTDFYADMNMQFGDVNLIFKPAVEGRAKPYVVVGGGIYYRPVTVTTPGVGYVPGYCDPWWYVCYPGGFVPVENIVGERSSTDFGMDFGGGVDFGLAENVRLYFEVRYHYIWGPEVNTNVAGTETKKANGQFLPITVGLRF